MTALLSTVRGQSLMEIVFAISIFTVGVVTIGYLSIEGSSTTEDTVSMTQARFLAREGIEVLGVMRELDFDMLVPGTYGIELINNEWALVADGDRQGEFLRTIRISDIDEGVKQIDSAVAWRVGDVREGHASSTLRVTDWRQSSGSAGDLSVDTDGVALGASSTELSGLTLRNGGDSSVAVVGMSVAWDGGETLVRVTIDGVDIFSVATTSGAGTGEFFDTFDYDLLPGSGDHSAAMAFSGVLSSTEFVVTFFLNDGSKKYVHIFL